MNRLAALMLLSLTAPMSSAQEVPKPGPEHEILKKYIGKWDYVMKIAGMEAKGTVSCQVELGGLWLVSSYEGDMFGEKFHGRGYDSYDAAKKKYVGVWMDNFSTTPLLMEGSYDKDKKTLTMIGDGPAPDGKITKHTMITTFIDGDNFTASMFLRDEKEPTFKIAYKRKK